MAHLLRYLRVSEHSQEKDRAQISFLEGEEYDYFFLVTNTEQSSEEVVEFYEKRGNCENYIKEAKYDLAVGHLLLQSFWANEAIFQLMMLAYNLNLTEKIISNARICDSGSPKMMHNGGNDAKLRQDCQNISL